MARPTRKQHKRRLSTSNRLKAHKYFRGSMDGKVTNESFGRLAQQLSIAFPVFAQLVPFKFITFHDRTHDVQMFLKIKML